MIPMFVEVSALALNGKKVHRNFQKNKEAKQGRETNQTNSLFAKIDDGASLASFKKYVTINIHH